MKDNILFRINRIIKLEKIYYFQLNEYIKGNKDLSYRNNNTETKNAAPTVHTGYHPVQHTPRTGICRRHQPDGRAHLGRTVPAGRPLCLICKRHTGAQPRLADTAGTKIPDRPRRPCVRPDGGDQRDLEGIQLQCRYHRLGPL